jgi:replication-associated recombination protein RarA
MATKVQKNVAEQLETVASMVKLVLNGQINALFIYGTPGIGKSSVVFSQLKAHGKREGHDFLFVKGVTRPLGLYTVLCENRGATIVFDDCDTAWSDADSANMLKAALEMSGNRVVSCYSKAVKDAGLPMSFVFTGSVIFISNLGEDEVDTAIRSRSYCYGVSATREQMAEFMGQMLDKIEPYVKREVKQEVLDYLKSVSEQVRSFDLRALIKAITIRVNFVADWREKIIELA